MRDATRLGLLALGLAALLGVLGDLLLRATPWGLNAPLWLAALVVGTGFLIHRAGLSLFGEGRWLALVAVFFAAGIAWRASPTLIGVNLLAVLLTLGIAAHRAGPRWPLVGGLPQYLGALLSAGVHACGGVLVLAAYDVRWREVPRTGWSEAVLAVLRGLLIAIPLLLVFGALFMAADAVFSGLVGDVLHVDVKELMAHVFWAGVWTWLTAGFLRQVVFCTLGADGVAGAAATVQPPLSDVPLTPRPETPLTPRSRTRDPSASRYPLRPPLPHAGGGGEPADTSRALQDSTGGAAAEEPDAPHHAGVGEPEHSATSDPDGEAMAQVDGDAAAGESRGVPLARPPVSDGGGTDRADSPSPAGTGGVAPAPRRPGGRVGWLGTVELGIVLGLLDLLFLAFVVVQFRYLFGGAELVRVSETLTYAEYARRGFFELVAVAALLLPIMLLLDWVARLDSPRDSLVYRALAGLLVVLLFVVIVSALQRMRIYTLEYGLTELRLYTTAFMTWITIGAVWYLATVLRDHRERFLFGALVAGLVVAATLDAIDPDDLIVRTNAARHDAPARFDGTYTMLLSADAAPALIEALPHIPEYQRVMVARKLLQRWESAQTEDWRSWNYGRWRAAEAVAANEQLIRQTAALPPTHPTVPSRSDGAPRERGSRLTVPGPTD